MRFGKIHDQRLRDGAEQQGESGKHDAFLQGSVARLTQRIAERTVDGQGAGRLDASCHLAQQRN